MSEPLTAEEEREWRDFHVAGVGPCYWCKTGQKPCIEARHIATLDAARSASPVDRAALVAAFRESRVGNGPVDWIDWPLSDEECADGLLRALRASPVDREDELGARIESPERLAAIIEEADESNPEWARGARFALGWVSGPGFAALDKAFQLGRDPAAARSKDPSDAR